MSKSSTQTAPKNSPLLAKSAWAKGPPQTATTPSPRSQSPAPSTPIHQTHSRRPSALGQGIPIKDGVSIPRNNVGSVKQGAAVTFGSIDDASAPISSSPAAAPAIKSEGVKSFGTVPATTSSHVNGKASISSRNSVLPPQLASSSSSTPATSSSSTPPVTTPAATTPPPIAAATPLAKAKIDVKKLFQNPSSAPSSNPPSDTSSPSLRISALPQQQQNQPQQQQPPSQMAPHSFMTFVPSNSPMRGPPNSGPNGGPPRSPQISRQMQNGNGPRSQGGQNGGPSTGMPSPRLGPHPHNQNPAMQNPPPQPPMPSQMPPHVQPWYYYPPEQQYQYYGWYGMPMQPPLQPPHQPPTPGPHMPQHNGMPMSPRNPPTNIQAPGTPTLSHTLPNATHPPHPPPMISHTPSSLGLSSPPPTPSTANGPRLNASSSAFVPSRKITLKKEDGTEVNLENLKNTPHPPSNTASTSAPQGSVYRQGSPGTPNRRPASIRIESEDQRTRRLEEEQKEKDKVRLRQEAEERAKKAKEEAERKAKEEEEERKRQEQAEKERLAKEEAEKLERERLKKEEEERLRKETELLEAQRLKEEEERKRKEEEEAKRAAEEKARKEEEDRIRKEKEEKERIAKEEEAQRLRLEQEEADKQAKAAAEAAAAAAAAEAAAAATSTSQDGKKTAGDEEGELQDGAKISPRENLRITTSPLSDRRRPGPLDLTATKNTNISAPPPSALATARIINDISTVSYPQGVSSPRPELNQNAKDGKFRYDRDFLLQFMLICKEKPAMLPPLDAIGLEPADPSAHSMIRGGSGRHRQASGSQPSRTNSIGLGINSSGFGKPSGLSNFTPPMGGFGIANSKLTSDDRFAMSSGGNRAASVSVATIPFRQTPMQRTASQGHGAPLRDRTRSKRGVERPNEANKNGGQGHPGHGKGGYNQQQSQLNLEPVVPLQATANRWDRKAMQADQDSPEMVDRKVKGLLNKLTMEKFDSISDQIITWANKSEKEQDGRTLIQVIRLVFEKATDEATWSEMYARLCRKMMEQISPKVQDDGIKNNDGKPIAGGQLFRKYLLNRCQEDFERGWVAKEATAAAAATKAMEDEAAKAAFEKSKGTENADEVALYSDEYYAAQKAKRQGLGLIKFIGELFKLQMLTERIMHECVKKLLGNVDNPEEEEIESLCKLLTTVGSLLDTPKARAHLDVYFSRMKELTKSPNVTPRMQYMLQDLVELRERKWQLRNAVAAPTTLAQIHENAAKEKAAQEKESYQRQMSMSRGGSRRGGDRGEFPPAVGPDGWAVAGNTSGPPRPPAKAGDLSHFGKISKGQPMTFGPGSVFAGKKGTEAKRESISRTSSSSNMFSMLQSSETAEAAKAAAEPQQRKKIVLAPRSKPVDISAEAEAETTPPMAEAENSNSDDEAAAPEISEAEVENKIAGDSKEFYGIRDLDEAESYFSSIPAQYHHQLIGALVAKAVESKEGDADLLAQLFARAASKGLCSPAGFEAGLTPIAETIDDVAIDAPKALQLFAIIIKGSGLDEEHRTRVASKSEFSRDRILKLSS